MHGNAPVNSIGITSAERRRELRRESDELLRSLFEEAPIAYHEVDTRGIVRRVNLRECQLLGFEPWEMLGKPIWEFVAENERETVRQAVRGRLSGELGGVPFQCDYVSRDGARITLEVHENLIHDGRGAAVGIRSALLDVTERRRAEEALRETEQKYRSIFENAVDGIFQIDANGRLLTANPALARIYGYPSPEELVRSGSDIRGAYVNPERRAELMRLLQESDSVAGFEAQLLRRDSSRIWVSVNARAVRGKEGELLRYEGTVQDISDRKQAVEELRQLSGRLLALQEEERRRIARDLHDTTAQALVAMKMEISLVLGAATKLDAKSREALSRSLSLAKQCMQDTRTLAYLLRPPLLDEAGLSSALRWYTKGFTERSGIKVELETLPDSDRLPRDLETTLFRFVQECLTNIHRHSGSPTARIRVARDGKGVLLEVRDDGRGMSPEVLEKARTHPGALGVGIAGLRERVEQLGGRLELCSGQDGTAIKAFVPIGEAIRGESPDSGR